MPRAAAAALLFFTDISSLPLLPIMQNGSPSCAAAYEGMIFVMAAPFTSARISGLLKKALQHTTPDIGDEIAEAVDMHNAALKRACAPHNRNCLRQHDRIIDSAAHMLRPHAFGKMGCHRRKNIPAMKSC